PAAILAPRRLVLVGCGRQLPGPRLRQLLDQRLVPLGFFQRGAAAFLCVVRFLRADVVEYFCGCFHFTVTPQASAASFHHLPSGSPQLGSAHSWGQNSISCLVNSTRKSLAITSPGEACHLPPLYFLAYASTPRSAMYFSWSLECSCSL